MRPVHFSHLKKFSESPAHYKHAIDSAAEFETTRPMRVGTIAHKLALGSRVGREIFVYEGDRRGNAWKEFAEEHKAHEIVTRSEYDDAEPIAAALLADRTVAPLLVGRKEVPIAWYEGDMACATSGVDVIGDGFILDLKTTVSAEPRKWMAQAMRMHYHAQLAFYRRGCLANDIPVREMYLIGVESSAPHCITVLRLPESVIELGDRSVTIWLERLRVCESAGQFPGYTQAILDLEVPIWMEEGEPE